MKLLMSVLLSAGTVLAQQGDNPGETQAPPPATMKIPPAPPLSVEDALKSFELAPGFRIEPAAFEPMIESPVELEFDPDGRIYVLEMRGFMPNLEGKGEDQPVGRISLLVDENGDGRMDKSTVFADGLVLPRAICVTRGGLLVAEPPQLWFFQDTNGDGKADEKTPVSADYGNNKNPEHDANGLLLGRDNWIYSANHTVRYQMFDGEWDKQPTSFRGQWGLSQDDYGRLFFNSNSDQFRGDLVPPQYLLRNPNFKNAFGLNVQIAKDQSTFPIRVTPGVNRGYQKGTLKPDGTLARFTAACGPVIYRGENFPPEFYGAGFVCEPAGNFVRCNFIREEDGILTATNAFPGREFLASSDERFRPVNLVNGPDGSLYVVDMYRGVIQHRIYVTTFLRNQAIDRALDKPVNMGRVYRVSAVNKARPKAVPLSKLSSADLVRQLSVTNGWVRDTAQQLLVERADATAFPALRAVAAAGQFPSAIHALWVLHAMGELSPEGLPLTASDSKVRATAIRVSEPLLRVEGSDDLRRKTYALAKDPSLEVRLQLTFSLGELKTLEADRVLAELLDANVEHRLVRDAAISGVGGRELRFMNALLTSSRWDEKSSGREDAVRKLSQCVAESRESERLAELLELASSRPQNWQKVAMLDGIAALIPAKGRGKQPPAPRPVRFDSEPAALSKLAKVADTDVRKRLQTLDPLLVWPGKPGMVETEVKPLSAAEQKLFEAGREQYAIVCGACHQPNGQGLEGLAPPLVDTEWATGSPERLTRIVLHGVRGPMNVKGRVWELEMPALNVLSDEELAGLMTYIRREWGHTASPILPEFVGKVRKETADRVEAWTEDELLKIK